MTNYRTESEYEKHETDLRKRLLRKIFIGTVSGIAIVAGGCALYSNVKVRKLERMVTGAVGDLAGKTSVDVEKTLVESAMNAAVNRAVGNAVNDAVDRVRRDISYETQQRVCDAVKNSYGQIEKSVTDAIAKEVSKVDRHEIVRDATEKAKDILVEKFDGKLDDLIADYNRNLDNVGKIYQSIASSMGGKDAAKDVTLKIG